MGEELGTELGISDGATGIRAGLGTGADGDRARLSAGLSTWTPWEEGWEKSWAFRWRNWAQDRLSLGLPDGMS
jgi:hypothetical protein